ncbi:4958_t:CDS:2 [Funneliformis geosporum]|uniref:4958_t:CDS:1 n=1 Tax=Funneliformis geosporum TaxID=1117311 RepID=A0A9W4SBP8_9GLOM|nr:4958_t:CDS:2 [Funneliformis geosporum]
MTSPYQGDSICFMNFYGNFIMNILTLKTGIVVSFIFNIGMDNERRKDKIEMEIQSDVNEEEAAEK